MKRYSSGMYVRLDRTLAGVFAVGGVIVATQNALKLLAQHALEDLRAARSLDFENDKPGGAEAPGPQPAPIVLVSGLITVEVALPR